MFPIGGRDMELNNAILPALGRRPRKSRRIPGNARESGAPRIR